MFLKAGALSLALLLASRLQKQMRPSGWPVENGWVSSLFGWRADPFTGRRTMHAGIDFAARFAPRDRAEMLVAMP